jgi:hypothetical protein
MVLGGKLSQAEAFVAGVRFAIYTQCLPMATDQLGIDVSRTGQLGGCSERDERCSTICLIRTLSTKPSVPAASGPHPTGRRSGSRRHSSHGCCLKRERYLVAAGLQRGTSRQSHLEGSDRRLRRAQRRLCLVPNALQKILRLPRVWVIVNDAN